MLKLRGMFHTRTPLPPAPQPVPLPAEPPVAKRPADAVILDRYRVPSGATADAAAEVTIYETDSRGVYSVTLPSLDEEERLALGLLKAALRNAVPVSAAGRPQDVLERYLWETAEQAGIVPEVRRSRQKLLYYLLRDFAGFWEIDTLVNDDSIEEISLVRYDRPVRILHRKFTEYVFMETDVSFESEYRLQAFIRRMAQFGGTTVSLAQPSLEVTLHGPSDRRFTATLGDEISRPGSTFAMRKQKEAPLTIIQLAASERASPAAPAPDRQEEKAATYEEDHFHKTLSALMAAYFWLLLERTTNVLVAGPTASGKTTLMNAILSMMNPRAKIVTAEDVLEVNLPDHLHWQRLKTRTHRAGLSPGSGRYEYDLADLLKLSLRFSPTILSLGEMRGEESETLAAAITLGFSTITTIHAESAERCVQRLTTAPMKFAAFVNGYTSKVRSGGDMVAYLSGESGSLLRELEEGWARYASRAGMVGSTMITVFGLIPLLLMVVAVFSPATSISGLVLFSGVGVPLFTVLLVFMAGISAAGFSGLQFGAASPALAEVSGLLIVASAAALGVIGAKMVDLTVRNTIPASVNVMVATAATIVLSSVGFSGLFHLVP